jgi:hypothetical protein
MRHKSLIFLDYVSPTRVWRPHSTRPQLPSGKLSASVVSSAPMYPAHVSDQDIQHLIRELTTGNQLPSGAQLRAAMHERFGSRGGVTRIYRLLSAMRSHPDIQPSSSRTPEDVESLHRELHTLREALKLADHREQTHQSRWALEVDRLRQQLAATESLAHQAKSALETTELLRRQLHAAHIRITVLEGQLMDNPRPK